MEKVMVSSCLLGDKCRYNGSDAISKNIIKYLEGKEVIPFCPEVMAGMSTPREPAEIINSDNKIVLNRKGENVTHFFKSGAQLSLKLAIEREVDLIILKSKSPSCGLYSIYDGTFTGKVVSGSGLTAELLSKNGFSLKDEGQI